MAAGRLGSATARVPRIAHATISADSSRKRKAETEEATRARRSPRTCASDRAGCQVLICNRMYTSVSWFLGCANPSRKALALARKAGGANAVEIQDGHTRALAPYACTPASSHVQQRSLTAPCARLARPPVQTEVPASSFDPRAEKSGNDCRKSSSWLLICRPLSTT